MTGEISQPNNATRPPGEARPFGIRVSVASSSFDCSTPSGRWTWMIRKAGAFSAC